MQRLLDKANELNAQQGIITNYQIDSYADIVDAIHVVQTEMGITGTTAKEAGTTIQGSVASMESAWTNLLTGLADGNANIEQLVDNLVTTIVGDGTESNLGVLGNILPAVETALNGASTLVGEALPKIMEIIPEIINENLPILVEAAVDIIRSLVDGISQNQEMLFDTIFGVVTYLAETFIGMLPQIVELGLNLIVSLADGIAESLPELIPTIVDVVIQIVETLIDNVDMLVDAAIEIMIALADGLINALPKLIEKVPVIITKLIEAYVNNAPKMIEASLKIIVALAEGLIKSIPQLIKSIPQIVMAIVNGFGTYMSKIKDIGKSIVTAIGDGIKGLASEALAWGKDLIDNFVGGIKSKISAVTSAVSRIASTVKSFLGFSEPEKGPLSNFHTYAPDMMDLFIKGIRDNEKKLTDQIEKTFDFGERTITTGISCGSYGDVGFSGGSGCGSGKVSVVQNIYSEAKTAADLMQEALYQQERAVLLGV